MSHCGLHCLEICDIGVTVSGNTILQDIRIHAHCGELTAIIGKNGAGKSTLLKAILNEVSHVGTVNFSGHNGAAVPHRPTIGYVPQRLDLDPGSPVTVYDMLASLTSRFPIFLPRRKTEATLSSHLSRFNADGLLHRPLGRLSGGELQRVLLAAATLPCPDLLLLDEPVSGVDQNGLLEFYRLLDRLKTDEDMVILLVSHDLDYVKHHADRVVLLDKTVEAVGTPSQVFNTAAFKNTFGEVSV